MVTYYADTSVLLKRHVDELGSRWFREIVNTSDVSILTSELSIVEMYSAFNRLVREGVLTIESYRDLTAVTHNLFAFRYGTGSISIEIRDIACGVLERHPLRAYDAMHLASAIFANQELVAEGKVGLTFLSADHRLLTAANVEGLVTFDPSTTV